MTLFCGIGLPGFIVSIAIGATMFGSMLLSLTVIDKVSEGSQLCHIT